MTRENQTCTFCGSKSVYAVGLCRKCYMRKRKNGTPEYKGRSAPRPNLWSENTKKILELHKGGMRQVDIVKEVGLTKQAVSIAIKKHAKPTNADRIREMTIEELAGILAMQSVVSPPWCAENYDCPYADQDPVRCDLCALDWLKQEAKENA